MKNFFSWMRQHAADSVFYIILTLILIVFVWVDTLRNLGVQPVVIQIAWCISISLFIVLAALAWIFQVYLKSTDQINQ